MSFPQHTQNSTKIKAYLKKRLTEIPSWSNPKDGFTLGFPQTKPNKWAIAAYKLFLEANPNNSGTMTRKKRTLKGTKRIELECIKMLASLFHGHQADGYITTGGTEGNIMGLWLGKEFLRKKSNGKICLIKTKLSHYSIDKAARLIDIDKSVNIKINSEYEMSLEDLQKKISKLQSKGYKNFIVVATVGYTVTGTSDPTEKISLLLSKNRIRYYLHVDAAFAGFVLPFIKNKIKFDFLIPQVKSLVVDPHKMGLVPYPAGVFLCRKNLLNLIAKKVEYTKSDDDTITGSRSGASAAACWAVLKALGKKGFMEKVAYCIELKKYFLKKLATLQMEVIQYSLMNVVAINFSVNLPKKIETKYRLFATNLPVFNKENKITRKKFYKFYFMPHMTKKMLDKAINDICGALK